tara:strand:+ start:85 stop:354 length:270 start_codon:yes stop_codon:yes gene_type:complete
MSAFHPRIVPYKTRITAQNDEMRHEVVVAAWMKLLRYQNTSQAASQKRKRATHRRNRCGVCGDPSHNRTRCTIVNSKNEFKHRNRDYGK